MQPSVRKALSTASVCLCLDLCLGGGLAQADPPASAPGRHSPQQLQVRNALARFNSWIGQWRGAGQVRRGSTRGSWQETAGFVWNFESGRASIVYTVSSPKHLSRGVLSWAPKSGRYTFDARFADGSTHRLEGRLHDGRLVLESVPKDTASPEETPHASGDGATTPAAAGSLWRITFRQLNDKRMTVLYEKRRPARKLYLRVGEVGYTRQGTRLAKSDSTGPECVVTGGAGTIAVTFRGETFYVCCTGCRDAFNDDPEGILAAYHDGRAGQTTPPAAEKPQER